MNDNKMQYYYILFCIVVTFLFFGYLYQRYFCFCDIFTAMLFLQYYYGDILTYISIMCADDFMGLIIVLLYLSRIVKSFSYLLDTTYTKKPIENSRIAVSGFNRPVKPIRAPVGRFGFLGCLPLSAG